jgi:hypothetical protein
VGWLNDAALGGSTAPVEGGSVGEGVAVAGGAASAVVLGGGASGWLKARRTSV